MWRTRVGYAGGEKPSPTYAAIRDHTECVQVDFDPEVVTYERLLQVFLEAHDPTVRPFSNQYASLILARDEDQRAAAQRSLERYEAETGRPVTTVIERLDRFYPAEDYHQKYYLRGDRGLMREFSEMYPDQTAFRDSTAAARVNGVLGGEGSAEQLAREAASFGLSAPAQSQLRASIDDASAACPVPGP